MDNILLEWHKILMLLHLKNYSTKSFFYTKDSRKNKESINMQRMKKLPE